MRLAALPSVATRLASLSWTDIETDLWDHGWSRTPPVLTLAECRSLTALYADDRLFRSRVDMARHRFGLGDYKYFAAPLPALVQQLRHHAYPPLGRIANEWMRALDSPERFPRTLAGLLRRCADQGQTRPTPLLLHYEAEGYNCLHQDVYGELTFPLQITAFLSRAGVDHTGGEFLLVEQRPRAQSVGQVVLPEQGELLIFTTRFRPARGRQGYHRVNVRHGVSRIGSGARYALGIIFHDAR